MWTNCASTRHRSIAIKIGKTKITINNLISFSLFRIEYTCLCTEIEVDVHAVSNLLQHNVKYRVQRHHHKCRMLKIFWRNWMKIGFVSNIVLRRYGARLHHRMSCEAGILWISTTVALDSYAEMPILWARRQIRRTRRNRATNKLCHVPVCSRAVTCAMRTCFTLNRSVVPIKCSAHAYTTTFLFCGNTLARTVCHRSSLALAKPAHSVHAHERTCANSEKYVWGTGTRESHKFIETDGGQEIEENEWINQD